MKNVLLLVAALVISCLGAEAAFRAAGFTPHVPKVNPFFVPGVNTSWSQPDPDLGWINKEGVAQSIGEGQAPMTFWDFGRRASRADKAPPTDGRTPVMVVGGSDAQAYGVRDEEGFIYLIAQRYPNLWFENFGGGGYSTVQALMMAERAYDKFYGADKPKVLLLTFGDSHVARNVSDQSWIYSISDSEGHYVSPPHYLLHGDDMAFHPFHIIPFWPLENHSAAVAALHDIWLRKVVYNTAGQGIAVTRRVLGKLADFAAQHHMVMAAVVSEDYTQVAHAVFDGQPFPYKDCSGPERTDHDATHLAGNNHPNAKLHVILAACIGDFLDRDVLPRLTTQP